jgi:tetratricopeptide (TPR) repeat protein
MEITLEEALRKGIEAHNTSKFREADKFFTAILQKQPKHPDANHNMGLLAVAVNKVEESLTFFETAIEGNPQIAQFWLSYSDALVKLERIDDAKRVLEKAKQKCPKGKAFHKLDQRTNQIKAASYNNIGITNTKKGEQDLAIDSYKNAIKIKPDYVAPYNNIGMAYFKKGELDLAIDSYKKAIKIKPDMAVLYNNIGMAYFEKGELDLAIDSYNKAIDINADYASPKVNLVECLTEYKSQKKDLHPIIHANQEVGKIVLHTSNSKRITDSDIARICSDGLDILKRNEVEIEFPMSQAYRRNGTDLNCRRHKSIFNEYNVIPKFCFGCYKVQIEPRTVVDLIKLFLVFDKTRLENNNNRKCMVEMRPEVSGFYKGLIYCSSLEEADQISRALDIVVKENIDIGLSAKVKRGCSEYPIAFPQYKEINRSGPQPMTYNEDWRSIEKSYDSKNLTQSKLKRPIIITRFSLNDILVIRNWLAYAQEIGDQSVNQITNENLGELDFVKLIKKAASR